MRGRAVRDTSCVADARVLTICIDAMSLAFAQSHLERLPVLRSLLARGRLIHLESPGTHMSACVWPTFATGQDAGEHGHYYPFQWDSATMSFRRTSKVQWSERFAFEPFWHGLARSGVETTVLDAGFVLDDAHAPCRQVSNWSYQSTGDASASDPGLLREIRRRFGRRPIGMEVPVPKSLRQSRRIRDSLIESQRRKADAVLWLMERDAWRFFLVGFYEVHRAGHNLLVVDGEFGSEADPDALAQVYEGLDCELGRIVEAVNDGKTTVVLTSLHGMIPNIAQDQFLPPVLARLNTQYLGEAGKAILPRKGSNLFAFLRKQVPYKLQYVLAHALGEDIQDWVVNRAVTQGMDWARTPSFRFPSGGEGYIRLNIKGRERIGYFDPSSTELDAYRRWLKDRLLEIRVVGTGEALVSDVLDAHDLFPGPRSDDLPDLIVKWAPAAPVDRIRSPAIGEITERLQTGRGGNHSGDSFVLVTGPAAESPVLAGVRHIRDLRRFIEAQFAPVPRAVNAPPRVPIQEPA